jgi:hypothetical protein
VRSYALAVLSSLLIGSAACSSAPATHSSRLAVAPSQQLHYVSVRNQHPLDVAVYLLRGGSRIRIGTVTAMSEGVLRLPPNTDVSGSDRLLIDPIGSDEVFVTDRLMLASEQQVEVTVSRFIRMSSMAVWTSR